jgi:flagellar biogenesis protein FliO
LILLATYFLKRFGRRSPLLAGSTLAEVLGKVYLAPRVCLHFVRTGGRVLVIGVTQQAIAVVAEFDAEAFERATETNSEKPALEGAESFLAQLRATMQATTQAEPAAGEDAEIAALRKDVQRLQQYLEEGAPAARP